MALSLFWKVLKTGVVTESPGRDPDLAELGVEVRRLVDARFSGSLAIRQVDAGSCNGCELEIQALNNPYYDIEQYGVHIVASPRHADALLVTGPVARHMEAALLRTYAAVPAPKYVIAAGTCACDGGEFGMTYASCGPVHNVIPVDLSIEGCPPTPLQLLQGIRALLGQLRPRSGND